MKSILRRLIPERIVLFYHRLNAQMASFWYGNPSKRLFVIGVTGTKGKSTTCNYIWSVLQQSGKKCALTGTANFRMGTEESLNPYHLSMPGAWVIQKFLRDAVNKKCTHAVVEATSEGIKQSRHLGIDFDIAVFTNLTPEHLPSHGGSFEQYRIEKGKLFQALSHSRKPRVVAVLNADSDHVDFFKLAAGKTEQITYSINAPSDVQATAIMVRSEKTTFHIENSTFEMYLPGAFNVINAVAAIAVGRAVGLSLEQCTHGIRALAGVPGRMEKINMGQPFSVWVDYAHEKQSMGGLLEALRAMRTSPDQKIIILLGAEGGGRDRTKRPIMGEQVGRLADYAVVSNVDPYEDDPTPIVEDIARAAQAQGKIRGATLFVIEDRRAGISQALALAQPGDLVAITGKGAEQSITIGGKAQAWDDRIVVKEELQKQTVPTPLPR